MLTQARLKDVLSYDPETGRWTWRKRISNRIMVGKEAGCLDPKGYRVIRIDGIKYWVHRLAYFYMTGEWPVGEVDHKDGNPGNDCWTNLRPATHQQNCWNSRLRSNNTSGFKGVYWDKQRRHWRPYITVKGKRLTFQCQRTPEAAHEAIKIARMLLHGEFARHK